MFDIYIKDYPLFFIFWNIFLAFIPIFLCYGLSALNKNNKKISAIPSTLIFFIWLFFLPNAPYIITDLRHINGFTDDTLLDISTINNWMIFFFFIYSIIGWVLFYYSIEIMLEFLKKYFSKNILNIFPIITIPIVALGLLLGLLDRLNSWDIVVRPFTVLNAAFDYISEAQAFTNLLIASISLFILYYFGRIIFKPKFNLKK